MGLLLKFRRRAPDDDPREGGGRRNRAGGRSGTRQSNSEAVKWFMPDSSPLGVSKLFARAAGVRCQPARSQRCRSSRPAYRRRSTVPRSTVPSMNGPIFPSSLLAPSVSQDGDGSRGERSLALHASGTTRRSPGCGLNLLSSVGARRCSLVVSGTGAPVLDAHGPLAASAENSQLDWSFRLLWMRLSSATVLWESSS